LQAEDIWWPTNHTERDSTYASLYHDGYHDSNISEPVGILITRNVQPFPESYGALGTAVTWRRVPPQKCAHSKESFFT